MSAPRPHETSPFHPPSSVYVLTNVSISVYIQKFSTYFFHVVFKMSFGTVYISPHALLQKHFGSHFVIDMVRASVRNLSPVFSLQSAFLS